MAKRLTLSQQVQREIKRNANRAKKTLLEHSKIINQPKPPVDINGLSTYQKKKFIRESKEFRRSYENRFKKLNDNLSIPLREYNELKTLERRAKEAQKRVRNEVQNLPLRNAGVNEDIDVLGRYLMGSSKEAKVFEDFTKDISKIKSRREFESYIKNLKGKEQNFSQGLAGMEYQYKENYLKVLEEEIERAGYASDDRAYTIYQKIKQLSSSTFLKYYYSDQIADINYLYDENDIDTLLDSIESMLENDFQL